jgi:hypothetical protein
MPKEMFEVASPFDDVEDVVEAFEDEALEAESLAINTRRASAEDAERLRLARAI